MSKCKICGKVKHEDKFVIRGRTNYFFESVLKIMGVMFLAVLTKEVWVFFLFLFLSGILFAFDIIYMENARTKKQLAGVYK